MLCRGNVHRGRPYTSMYLDVPSLLESVMMLSFLCLCVCVCVCVCVVLCASDVLKNCTVPFAQHIHIRVCEPV